MWGEGFCGGARLISRMKTLMLSLTCVTGLVASAGAQVFQPQTARNILVGSVAGAIIGENNNHRALEGAAIGAAAGLLWSAATVPHRDEGAYDRRVRTSSHVQVYQPPVCEPPRVVAVCPPYDPPRRVIVTHRPLIVERRVIISDPCPPRVVYRYDHRDRRDDRHHHGYSSRSTHRSHRDGSGYDRPGYGRR